MVPGRWSMTSWLISCWARRRPRAWSCSARTVICPRTKAVLERTLAEEMTGHLGYGKRPGRVGQRQQP
jgi:hypothetical protein